MRIKRETADQGTRTATRRRFLKTATLAAGATAWSVPTLVRGRNLNDKLNIAIIGAGGRGGSNMRNVASENIVALCDVNEANLDRAAKRHPKAKRFVDFRKLFDHPDLFDAVVVSTCEHTHAFATLPALQLGKHVYCEKPLTHNVWEARIIRAAAARAKVATQMGTQIHAGNNYRRVVELIQSGAIGAVHEAHVWVSRAWGWHASEADAKRAKDIVFVQERPTESDPVPATLNWDLWLGPAPARPFNRVYFPGPKWYRWWDFGNGTMSDLGSHWNDLPYWALKLDAPQTVESFGIPPHPEIAPASMTAVYQYGKRGELPPVTMTWYQGTHKPEIWKQGKIPQWKNAVLFVGRDGMLLSDYKKHVLLPEDKFVDFKRPDPFIPDSPGHHKEWLLACRGEGQTGSPFSYAGPLTEANHLGNVAYRVGKKITWDAKNMKCTGCPEADPFIKRKPREGWSL
jgi:predicted dehydrogenase